MMSKRAVFVCALAAIALSYPSQAARVVADYDVRNGSFENPAGADGATPANWMVMTESRKNAGIIAGVSMTGDQSFRFQAMEKPNGYQGLVQEVTVIEKEKYTFTVHAKNSKSSPMKATGVGQLVVEWLDEDGQEVGREWTPHWTHTLSRMRWTKFQLKNRRAPRGAVKARVGVHMWEGSRGSRGEFYVDNIAVEEK